MYEAAASNTFTKATGDDIFEGHRFCLFLCPHISQEDGTWTLRQIARMPSSRLSNPLLGILRIGELFPSSPTRPFVSSVHGVNSQAQEHLSRPCPSGLFFTSPAVRPPPTPCQPASLLDFLSRPSPHYRTLQKVIKDKKVLSHQASSQQKVGCRRYSVTSWVVISDGQTNGGLGPYQKIFK